MGRVCGRAGGLGCRAAGAGGACRAGAAAAAAERGVVQRRAGAGARGHARRQRGLRAWGRLGGAAALAAPQVPISCWQPCYEN